MLSPLLVLVMSRWRTVKNESQRLKGGGQQLNGSSEASDNRQRQPVLDF